MACAFLPPHPTRGGGTTDCKNPCKDLTRHRPCVATEFHSCCSSPSALMTEISKIGDGLQLATTARWSEPPTGVVCAACTSSDTLMSMRSMRRCSLVGPTSSRSSDMGAGNFKLLSTFNGGENRKCKHR